MSHGDLAGRSVGEGGFDRAMVGDASVGGPDVCSEGSVGTGLFGVLRMGGGATGEERTGGCEKPVLFLRVRVSCRQTR